VKDQQQSEPPPLSLVTSSSLWPPRLISDLSAWNQHVPFAGWIIEAIRPAVFVELGTHAGVSYFAFCESVARHNLGTRCFAVDTWLGDEHAGFYGEEIYNSVSDINTRYYDAFSKLVRTTFDEAVEEFEDGSIDLLHLDGLHTYEAVKHDFETWLPKLSDRAVMLFHDTNERKADFGVHRLLAEIKGQYPVFEFTHGHGLGVVAIGKNIPRPVTDLIALNDDPPRLAEVRNLYEALGSRHSMSLQISQTSQRLADAREQTGLLNAAIERRESDIARLNASVEQRRGEIDELRAAVDRRDATIADLKAKIERSTAEVAQLDATLKRELRDRDLQLADRAQELAASRKRSANLEETVNQRENQIADLAVNLRQQQTQIASMTNGLKKRDKQLAESRKKVADTRRSLERLRKRRSIRTALALSAVFRPVFRTVRRIRKALRRGSKKRSDPTPSEVAPGRPDESTPTMVPPPSIRLPRAGSEAGRVTILIPVHNAPEELDRCLASVVRNTTGDAQLLVIDDASDDARVTPVLDAYSTLENVTIVHNEENLGFVRTVNRGFSESSGDVVILNSDVRVPPGWLDRLRLAARTVPDAATITPLSDNAGAFSAPRIGTKNTLPPGLTDDEIGRLIAQRSLRLYPSGPTGNGFCMYVRRACLEDVGLFDAKAFPRGYGEENDLCMRALTIGWKNIVDDSTYVFHSRSASFGDEKHALMEAGRRVLDERYPQYGSLVREFVSSAELVAAQHQIEAAFTDAERVNLKPRPRLLFVLHAAGGGTPATTRDLIDGLDDEHEAFVLVSDGRSLTLSQRVGAELVEVARYPLRQPITVTDDSHAEYRDAVQAILIDYSIETVHIRHLIGHTFELPPIAASLGIPVVLSFHDFYYICPTVHLMDNNDRFCGGQCTPGQGECEIPTRWLEGLPHLKHAWVYDWRKRSAEMFNHVSAFVTASQSAKNTYIRAFPELENRRFDVIEHGRDLDICTSPASLTPHPDRPVRILLPGNLGPHKGSVFVQKLQALDTNGRLEFHVLGKTNDDLSQVVTSHGTYARSEFEEKARVIAPSFVGLFSTTAESFSHVLTEAWAAGIPVLASRLGALEERIERDGGGWLFDINDPAGTYARILEIVADVDGYRTQQNQAIAAAERSRSIADMAFDYAAVYAGLANARRPFVSGYSRPGERALRVGVFLPAATIERVNPSGHIRVLRRLQHPPTAAEIVWKLVDGEAFASAADQASGIDIAVVQRTAVPPTAVDDFLKRCRQEGVGVVYDIDDDLLSDDPDWDERDVYGQYREAIEILVRSADVVTVSTPALAEVMSSRSDRIVVLPNALDRALWLQPIDPELKRQFVESLHLEPDILKLLFVGGPSHAEDLEILKESIDQIRQEIDDPVELYVVGGARPTERKSWYQPIDIPGDRRYYPRFVEFIRSIGDQFDLGVAPLADTRLNSSKSDLRFLEYTALGLAGIYSQVPAFDSVEDGKTGLTAANTTDAWASAIVRLLRDEDLRQGLHENALEYLMSQRLIGGPNDPFYDLLTKSVRVPAR
jgi:GT2 family glycosyltransferase/glycosyltransferase involved in cell wall biosynthesis/septal ring factor EnvC (AmiA/AmiB activator)